MFLLEFILDNGSVEDALEAVEQFEFTHYGIIVIKALSDNAGKSSLELFDLSSKDKEVLVELLLVDVHCVVGKGSEVFNSFLEFIRDLLQCFSECFSFGTSELNSFKFVELHNSGGEMEDIMASLAVCIQS